MSTHTSLDSIEATTKAIDALLAAIDGAPVIGAASAYKSAIRRHGVNLAASAGPAALDQVLARIRADAPDKAAASDREAIVLQAWNTIAIRGSGLA